MENVFNQSLWGDEAFSAILSMKSIPDIIKIISRDTSPPLYNLTEHLAFQFFGNSEVVIRSLSFFYYLLTIFFVYKITSHIWSRKTGLFAAILTFLNPFFFIYAFEGRMYSILALGVTASMYFFLTRKWVPYVIATAWALYSHHFAIFAVVVQGIWFLKELVFGDRGVAKKMLKSFLAIIILYIPWLIPLYKQIMMVKGGFWLGTPTLKDLGGLITDYLALGIKNKLAEPALYFVFGILLVRNWTEKIQKTIFLLSWFLLPILITWLISQKFTSIFYNRYLLYAIPAAMIILATNKRNPASTILIGALIILFSIVDYNYFTHPIKKPFSEFASYVKGTKLNGDFIINWNSSSHHLWETKYYGIPGPIYIPEKKALPYFVGTALMGEDDIINEIPKSTKRVGVVTSGSEEEVKIAGYKKESSKNFGDLKYLIYDKL